jgi:hypothetical protein
MDNVEAARLLEDELTRYRALTYAQLVDRLHAGERHEQRVGPSGAEYQLETLCIWDGEPGKDILVIGSIDDGGWRAFAPLTRSFIKARDGTFVGE